MKRMYLPILATALIATTHVISAGQVTVADLNNIKTIVADFNALLERSKTDVVIVDFHTTGCRPCKTMMREVGNLVKKLTDGSEKPVHIAKILIKNRKHPLHNGRLTPETHGQKVRSFPTILVLHDGKIVYRNTGIVKAAALMTLIAQYSA